MKRFPSTGRQAEARWKIRVRNAGFTLPAVSATSYTVQARPIGAQLTRDTQCGTLSLGRTGARGPATAGCW